MKQIIKCLTIILLVLLSFSCQKFVDIKRDSTQEFIETISDCQLLLNNYSDMNTGYPSDGEASADNYYLNEAGYLATTTTAEDRDIYSWRSTAIHSSAAPQWQTPYRIVYFSNLVLEALTKIEGSEQSVKNDIRGQALFFRAYSFWQIAQLYTKPYSAVTANLDLGIPLRLSSDINGKSERGTLEQTYSKITTDLLEAVDLLSPALTVASRPSKAAAYAMLARVYLSMEDYQKALINANAALKINNQLLDYSTLNITSNTPFDRFNKEVVFHSLMTRGITMNPGSATNNTGKIDLSLVAMYDTNDLRRSLFFKANSGSHTGSFRFTGNYEPVTVSTFFNGIANDELYLTRAECYARSGNIPESMADLNTLLRTRWKVGTYKELTANTADEALSKILVERRKELLMRGLRWTDLRRLNKDSRFAVTLTRTILGETYTLPPNDPRYTLLIPNEVINNSELSQNER